MTKIIGAGCSLIEGAELNSYKQTWPYKIAERNGCEYYNEGHIGVGNRYIAKKVIDRVAKTDGDMFVIIQWTYCSRYDYIFSHDTKERNSPWYTLTPAHLNLADKTVRDCFGKEYIERIKEFGTDKWAEYHYKHLGDDNELDNTLSSMLLVQEYLRNRNIPYLFTTAENWHDYNAFNDNKYSTTYFDSIDWNKFKWFPHDLGPTGFIYWANANNFEKAPLGHPLEPAHEAAADIMEKYYVQY